MHFSLTFSFSGMTFWKPSINEVQTQEKYIPTLNYKAVVHTNHCSLVSGCCHSWDSLELTQQLFFCRQQQAKIRNKSNQERCHFFHWIVTQMICPFCTFCCPHNYQNFHLPLISTKQLWFYIVIWFTWLLTITRWFMYCAISLRICRMTLLKVKVNSFNVFL